jgi:hypothetical protein
MCTLLVTEGKDIAGGRHSPTGNVELKSIYRVDYDDNDQEELEESEVRILLCVSELDTAATSIVTRQTWDLVHHLRLMHSKGIDRSLGFDFSGNLSVCPCLRGLSCSLPHGLPDAVNPHDPQWGERAALPRSSELHNPQFYCTCGEHFPSRFGSCKLSRVR